MKTVSKAIAIQMKKQKDLEKRKAGEVGGVYGKKLHANQSDVLNVQEVGRNETFNQIVSGVGANADQQAGRKNQIKKRREALRAEKNRRRNRRTQDDMRKKDDTVTVYKELLEQMKDQLQAGYDTSDTEEEDHEDPDKEDESELDEVAKNQLALEDATKHKWYIIPSRSKIKTFWDTFIIVFAVINGIALPLDMAFERTFQNMDERAKANGSNFSNIQMFEIFDYLTIIVFTVDIVIAFLSSFINVSTGDEIFDIKLIAINYVFVEGSFWVDFISTIPWDYFASSSGAS